MDTASFIKFLNKVKSKEDTGVFDPDEIEMRWTNSYDGDTKWRPLTFQRPPYNLGWFPYQADYRFRKGT
jgi:hypothetical protein